MTLMDFMKNIKPHLPLPVIRVLEFVYYRLYLKGMCLYLDASEKGDCAAKGFPTASLRYRVNGRPELAGFLAQGEACCRDLQQALADIGRNLDSFRDLLDFGCGCGRTLRWFEASAPPRFSGTDIDAEAVSFCRSAFAGMHFAVNTPLPPLPYPDGRFDLIYSISVLTHLNEEYQYRWLEELRRVAAPGGIVLLSLHGRHCWGNLPPEIVDVIEAKGFLFSSENVWKGIFPEWYQTAFHTEAYARDRFSRYFRVLDYRARGISNYHDLVVLQKP